MEKIDLSKLMGNRPADYDEDGVPIPFEDIEMLAEKINEIIDSLKEHPL